MKSHQYTDRFNSSIRHYPALSRSLGQKNGDIYYEIIAGERRFRAAKLIKLKEIPITIHDINDHDSAAFALIENLQREDLNVIEKAMGIKKLIENFDITHEACGKILGQSRSAISNTLRLLDLSDIVQEAIADKDIEMGHARALLGVDKAKQYELLGQVRLQGLSVRETERLIQEQNLKSIAKTPKRHQKSALLKQIEAQLSEHLKTKVNLSQRSNKSGKITLIFSNEDSLDKLIRRLGLK